MAKKAKTAVPTITRDLAPERTQCPHCERPIRADYANHRTLHTLEGVTRLNLTIRRCHHAPCSAYKRPYRPEAEGAVALPRHEFGLDVIALIGRLRYSEHRSVPEIRAPLTGRGLMICERTVTNLLERYDELLADDCRLKSLLANQGRVRHVAVKCDHLPLCRPRQQPEANGLVLVLSLLVLIHHRNLHTQTHRPNEPLKCYRGVATGPLQEIGFVVKNSAGIGRNSS